MVIVGARQPRARPSPTTAGFTDRGFPVAALVDADPAKVGTSIGDHRIDHVDHLPERGDRAGVAIGVIATPAGRPRTWPTSWWRPASRSILNFAPAVVSVPEGASLRKVDLAVELQILSFYQQRRGAPTCTRSTCVVEGRPVLVVGGGAVAVGKVARPARQPGAVVTVVAPSVGRARSWPWAPPSSAAPTGPGRPPATAWRCRPPTTPP